MPWTQTAPGRYERPFDDSSRFIVTYCTRAHKPEHWIINNISKLEFDASLDTATIVQRLKRAWLRARYAHPFIATTLAENAFVYNIAENQQELEAWAEETVTVQTEPLNAWIEAAAARPNQWSTVNYFPATSELLLRCHHFHTDGVGSLNLLNKLLTFFAEDQPVPQFGDEWKNLPPGFTESAGYTPPDAAAQAEAGKMIQDFLGAMPSTGLPVTGKGPLGGGKRHRQAFNEATTTALVAACKSRGVSVASAVHAAITLATQEMTDTQYGASKYTSMGVINYRPHLPPPYNDGTKWPLGVVVWGVPFTRAPSDDFLDHARQYHQLYHQPFRKGETRLFDLYDSWIGGMAQVMSQPPPADMPPGSQPMLSSVGIADKYVAHEYKGKGVLRVWHVEVFVDMMNPEIVMYQWSYRGRWYLSANYNAALFEGTAIDAYMRRISDILFKELGVAPEPISELNITP